MNKIAITKVNLRKEKVWSEFANKSNVSREMISENKRNIAIFFVGGAK